MAKINVKEPFILNLGDAGHKQFVAGLHDVNDEVAAHWYVQHHAEVLNVTEEQPEQPIIEQPAVKKRGGKRKD